MGGNSRTRTLGLRLVWMSPVHHRERHDTLWYETATTRATAREKFEKEMVGGKPKFIRIEELRRDR